MGLGGIGRKLGIAAATGVAALAFAAPASAVNRFASPTGNGSGGPQCTQSAPASQVCSISQALSVAVAPDDVTLLGGQNYPTQTSGLSVLSGVTVHGTPGAPVTVPLSTNGVFWINGTAAIRDVRIIQQGTTAPGVQFFGAGTGERLYVDGGSDQAACLFSRADTTGTPALLRDSVCWSRDTGGTAISVQTAFGFTNVVTLRNVTAVGNAPGAAGIRAAAANLSTQVTVHATNVIARGDDSGPLMDVEARTDGSANANATVNLDHSNYSTVATVGAGSVTHPSAGGLGNVSTQAVFEDLVLGDFDQSVNSAGTIDRGTSAAVGGFGLGALDLGGGARCTGSAPDIGADERPGTACQTAGAALAAVVPPGPTGERDAAVRKCRKKARKNDWPKKRRKRCLRRARQLPV